MKKLSNLTSVYWGFFTGGARNVHTDIIRELGEDGVSQRIIHYFDVLDRGKEGIQSKDTDHNYSRLQSYGVPIDSLGLNYENAPDLYANIEHFSGDMNPEDPLEKIVRHLANILAHDPSPYIISLKEQPVNLLVLADRYLEEVLHKPAKPIFITLHRTDPAMQDPRAMEVLKALEHNPQTKKYITGYIACASSAALAYQNALGLEDESERFTFVPNGINLDIFKHYEAHEIEEARQRIFAGESFIPSKDTPIITIAARNSYEKNPRLFVQAAWLYLSAHPDAHVVMCGSGMTRDSLAGLFEEADRWLYLDADTRANIESRVHCLGKVDREDIAKLYNVSDVVSLTSPTLGEADPLVLKEGMACGAIPVSTCTGDTAFTVGMKGAKNYRLQGLDEGFLCGSRGILTSQNPHDVAQAWDEAITHRQKFLAPIQQYLPDLNRAAMTKGFHHAMHSLIIRHAISSRQPITSAVDNAILQGTVYGPPQQQSQRPLGTNPSPFLPPPAPSSEFCR